MAMKEYRWRGSTYKIADEDLKRYPGAELVVKAKPEPKNKRRTVKNKAKGGKA